RCLSDWSSDVCSSDLVLGPNGAGKTTAVRILATLTLADAGEASVAGFDIRHHPAEVRARIGLTGQFAALDEVLTGRENLEMIAQIGRASCREREKMSG